MKKSKAESVETIEKRAEKPSGLFGDDNLEPALKLTLELYKELKSSGKCCGEYTLSVYYVNDKDDSDTKCYRIDSSSNRSMMLRDMVKSVLDFFMFEINLHYPIDVIVISAGGLFKNRFR